MSDNLKRYRAIKDQLWQMFPDASAKQHQYLLVLSQLISGIVGSRQTQLNEIAAYIPGQQRNKAESRIMQYRRWLKNTKIDHQLYFAPFARALLARLSEGGAPLILIIDASQVGQGCMALMLNVLHQGRALPLGWLVVKAKKGHLAQAWHLALLEQVQPLIPASTKVTFVGDGEFDGVALLERLQTYHWQYVCRTAKSSRVSFVQDGQTSETNFAGLAVEQANLVAVSQAHFSEARYGPILAIAEWQAEWLEPIYLVSNLNEVEAALAYYHQRFYIETFFSDLKTRGFHLNRSHLRDPRRLERLMLAACLAYLWLVYLGSLALNAELVGLIHRTDRLDLSLFSLGLRLLVYLLNEGLRLPVAFVPLRCVLF
jgi:hypothetical protein